ncbi:MAG: ABC transporter [Saprospirales bacterium]|nr:ABC transporter [Saprospirales bacterium]
MPKEKIYSPGWRFRTAYWTTTVVIASYLWLKFLSFFFNNGWYEKRLRKLHLRNAERIKLRILQLRGLFIKIGQALSVLGNFLPEDFQKHLEELQDQAPARPLKEVAFRIRTEFGKEPQELFKWFDENPVASASIAQVHKAHLPDGTVVAVKVQHANIDRIAEVDLLIVKRIIKVVSWIFSIKGLDFAYVQLRKMIEEELDFRREFENISKIKENLREEKGIVIPAVFTDYSTGKVLTMAWEDGIKINKLEKIEAWKLDKKLLAERLLRIYSHMIFKDGFYHADPHPGNILVRENGDMVLLDFGAVAQVSRQMREGIPQLIEAALRRNTDEMISAFRFMGFLAEGKEAERMAERMINALTDFLENEIHLKGLNFKEIEIKPFENSLFQLIREIGISGITGSIQVPKDWVLLNRTLTQLIGICAMLDPNMNPLEVVRPYVKEFVKKEDKSSFAFITSLLRRTLVTAMGLPDEMHTVLQKAKRGDFEVQTPDIKEGAKLLYQAGQQFVYTLLIITAGIFGYLFYQSGAQNMANYSYIVAGFFFLLLMRSLRKGSKIRKRLE